MIDAEKIFLETYPDLQMGQDNKRAKKYYTKTTLISLLKKNSI